MPRSPEWGVFFVENLGKNKPDTESKCLKKEVFVMVKESNFSKKKQTSIHGGIYPSEKYVPGESVDQHKELEDANVLITGDEIRQQNENL